MCCYYTEVRGNAIDEVEAEKIMPDLRRRYNFHRAYQRRLHIAPPPYSIASAARRCDANVARATGESEQRYTDAYRRPIGRRP